MNSNPTAINTLFEKAGDFGKISMELFKLQAIDKSAEVLSVLASRLVIAIAVALFCITISIGLALWLGALLGKYYYGFFIVAAFYAVLTLLIFRFRKSWIKEPVSSTIITKMMQ